MKSKHLGENPKTFDDALQFVKQVESVFNNWDLEAVMAGFTDDCIVRFADAPVFEGTDRIRSMFTTRHVPRRDYRLIKTLKAYVNDIICNSWDCEWLDPESDAKMAGFGCEFWTMRHGKIAIWEGAINSWTVTREKPSRLPPKPA